MNFRPSRLLLKLSLFVLAGAMVNVGVAWRWAVQARPTLTRDVEFVRSHLDDPTWFFVPSRDVCTEWVIAGTYPFADVGWQYLPEQMPRWSIVNERPSSPTDRLSDIYFWVEGVHGWPLLSMRARVRLGNDMQSITERNGVIVLNGSQPIIVGGRMLPLQPLWPGFAINTIFYAAILWMLFAIPFSMRRWRRRRRGLCPACVYPVGESATCTECGHSLKCRQSSDSEVQVQ